MLSFLLGRYVFGIECTIDSEQVLCSPGTWYTDVVTAAAASGKYQGGDTTPFVPISLRLYRSDHTGRFGNV